MSIRESIARMKAGDPPLVVEHRHQADYIKALAKQNGKRLKHARQPDGTFELLCIGRADPQLLFWLNKFRIHRRAKQRWREKHPEKYKCQLQTRKFVREGILTRQSCEECGDMKSYAYHPDYLNPLDVKWLCHKHRKIHIDYA